MVEAIPAMPRVGSRDGLGVAVSPPVRKESKLGTVSTTERHERGLVLHAGHISNNGHNKCNPESALFGAVPGGIKSTFGGGHFLNAGMTSETKHEVV